MKTTNTLLALLLCAVSAWSGIQYENWNLLRHVRTENDCHVEASLQCARLNRAGIEARVMVVGFAAGKGHAYLVYRVHDEVFVWDKANGSIRTSLKMSELGQLLPLADKLSKNVVMVAWDDNLEDSVIHRNPPLPQGIMEGQTIIIPGLPPLNVPVAPASK
jgi:hypothetical protein